MVPESQKKIQYFFPHILEYYTITEMRAVLLFIMVILHHRKRNNI
jgi:hypothetical protein